MSKDNGNIFCAEPSPDALSAFAASFGGGLAAADAGSASFAGALSEGAGSIGLRTQTITLLRDSLFRVCEAGYNKQIGPLMVAQLHERFQDVTVALLAIEQLTGAVVAQQVLLTGRANANAAAAVLDAERYLREAEERERMATEKLERSQQAVTNHEATVATNQTTFGAGPCTNNVPDDPADPNHELCQGQQNDLNEANSELEKARDQETKDREALSRATENREVVPETRTALIGGILPL